MTRPGQSLRDISTLEAAWRRRQLVVLAPPEQTQLAQTLLKPELRAELEAAWGPGVVVGSGGSTGGRRWCLQPLSHLEASAAATAEWLGLEGLDPAACLHLNPLPLHHVSGLLPLVRSHQWGARHQLVPSGLLREPEALVEAVVVPDQPVLISLVPTQLARLMAVPQARAWLRQLAVVWVGGAALPEALADQARSAGIRLAPCYGATETAAMVSALPPGQFLAGASGCGQPLADVRLRVDLLSQAVEVLTTRLSPGWIGACGPLEPLPRTPDGWWRSGDGGWIGSTGLEIFGRLDGAIQSGGETVFPEQLEQRLRALAQTEGWPLQELLLLPVAEPGWGERLTALVRPAENANGQPANGEALISMLQAAVAAWPPPERPRQWLLCESLAPSPQGKWQRSQWQQWLQSLEVDQSPER
jgi:O-succinylbenzoic acid--CoA ligase